MSKIHYYSGGIDYTHLILSTNGSLSNFTDKIPQSLVAKAFREAQNAQSLPPDTKFETGCVISESGVESWFEFNGKTFIESRFLIGLFNNPMEEINRVNSPSEITAFYKSNGHLRQTTIKQTGVLDGMVLL